MKIFTLVPPSTGLPSIVHPFSCLEDAVRAQALYAFEDWLLEEVPFRASEFAVDQMTAGSVLTVYFILDDATRSKPVHAYSNYNEYKDIAHGLDHAHPYVVGVMNGLQSSIAKGTPLYRVQMFPDLEPGPCTIASAIPGEELMTAPQYTYDPTRGVIRANRWQFTEQAPFVIFVFATDLVQAQVMGHHLLRSYITAVLPLLVEQGELPLSAIKAQ